MTYFGYIMSGAMKYPTELIMSTNEIFINTLGLIGKYNLQALLYLQYNIF